MSFTEEGEEEEDSEYAYLLNTWDPLLSSTADHLLDEGILDDWHLTPPFLPPHFHPPGPTPPPHFTWPRDTSEEEEEYLEKLNHDVAMTETVQEVQTTKDTTIMEQFEMEPKTVEPTEPAIEVKIQVCSRVQRMMELFEEQKRQVEQLKIKREIVDSDDEQAMDAQEETALGTPLDPEKPPPPAKKRKAARRHSIESSAARRSRLKRNRSKLSDESAEHREARLAKQRIRDAERRLRRLEDKAAAEAEAAAETSADKVKSPGAPKQPPAEPKDQSGQCQVVSRRRSTSDLSLYSPHPMALRARRPIKY